MRQTDAGGTLEQEYNAAPDESPKQNLSKPMNYYPGHHFSRPDPEKDKDTKRGVLDNHQRIANLEKEVADLSALVEGMWKLLQSNGNLSDDNLKEAIAIVIEEKKNLKEKKRGCKTCARFVSAQYKKCIYCGGELVGKVTESVF